MARKSNITPSVPAICILRNITRFVNFDITECSFDMAQDVLNKLDELTNKFTAIADDAKAQKIQDLESQLAALKGE